MSEHERYKEMCELLKIWVYVKTNKPEWYSVLYALQETIDGLFIKKESDS